MDFRKFAVVLVVVQTSALSAWAQEHKSQQRDADRMTAAHRGADVHYTAQRPSKMDPIADPALAPTYSANGG